MDLHDTNRIGVLRVHGAQTDTPALRLAVSTQVAALDIRSPAMPPASILIVKKLADPDPGGIGGDSRVFNLNRHWESALNACLDDAYHSALSPQNGVLPSDTETVLFADHAELLACLLNDLVNGRAGDHWWWDQLLQKNLAAEALSTQIRAICSEHIDALPAAFGQLQIWRRAEPVLIRIEAEDAAAICLALCQSHALPEWTDMLAARTPIESRDLPAHVASIGKDTANGRIWVERSADRASSFREGTKAGRVRTAFDPWISRLGPGIVPGHLPNDQRLLLGLGLMLHRMPWVLSRNDFRQRVAEWLAAPGADDSGYDFSAPGTGAATRAEPDISADTGRGDAAVPPLAEEYSAANGRKVETSRQGKSKQRPRADDRFAESTEIDGQSAVKSPQDVADEQQLTKPDVVSAEPAIADLPPVEPVAPGYRYPSDGVTLVTDLGGVLYLINFIEALEVPTRFERDWGLASRLSRWALLESLARALLAADFETYRDDPIWELLADLDDRNPGDAVGIEVIAAQGYTTPAAWHEYLSSEEQTYYWAAARGVLRLWSSDGYLLIEAPRSHHASAEQARFALRRYLGKRGCFSLSRRAFKDAPVVGIEFCCGRNLRGWLARATPVLRRYLELKLGREDAGKPFEIRRLLRCPGQIHVTPTRIDIVTVLDRISLEARACGLDRDPGWLPQYSRSVRFHFN